MSNEFKKNKKTNFLTDIKNYIKDKKIHFNGKTIVLVVSGIAIATLLLGQDASGEPTIQYTPNHLFPITENVVTAEKIEQLEIAEIKTTEKIEEKNQDTKPITENNTQDKIETPPTIIHNTKEPPIQEPVTSQNSNIEQIQNPSEQDQQPIETQMQVTIHRSNGSVITISIEEYLIGVVAAEMPASFQEEALKAQAIVARTYALKRIQNNQILTDTSSTQVYKDNNELRNMWGNDFNKYYNKVKNAVESTKGLVVTYKGEYIDAVYHSTSNGKTEDAVQVWGNNIPYLKSVDSMWDKNSTPYLQTQIKDFNIVLNLLGIDLNNTDFEILERNDSGRITNIRIGNHHYTGVQLRNILGLYSTDFDLEIENSNLIITTRGWGHGVGMSQYGANGMAKEGYNYKQILTHYYQGIEITKHK